MTEAGASESAAAVEGDSDSRSAWSEAVSPLPLGGGDGLLDASRAPAAGGLAGGDMMMMVAAGTVVAMVWLTHQIWHLQL